MWDIMYPITFPTHGSWEWIGSRHQFPTWVWPWGRNTNRLQRTCVFQTKSLEWNYWLTPISVAICIHSVYPLWTQILFFGGDICIRGPDITYSHCFFYFERNQMETFTIFENKGTSYLHVGGLIKSLNVWKTEAHHIMEILHLGQFTMLYVFVIWIFTAVYRHFYFSTMDSQHY